MVVAKKSSVTLLERVRWLLNTTYHQLNTLVSGFMLYIIIKNTTNNNNFLHFLLTTLAYFPLMAEGIMMFSEANVWSLKIGRHGKYYIHGPLLAISTIAMTVGIVIIIDNKNKNNGTHFVSYHAIFGLTSWVLTMVSVVIGLFAFYSSQLRKIVRPVILKCVHNFFGIAAFVLGAVSLIYGLETFSFRSNTTETERLVTVWLLSIITAATGVMASLSLYNQLKDIFF